MQSTDSAKIATKVLGDAGEHYALSQFSFAERPAAKMPDNWPGYDLVVAAAPDKIATVSVKTRRWTPKWRNGAWFEFDDTLGKQCDWLVLIFKDKDASLKSWVIPFDVARNHAAQAGANARPRKRDIKWAQLQKPPLNAYQENWSLQNHE